MIQPELKTILLDELGSYPQRIVHEPSLHICTCEMHDRGVDIMFVSTYPSKFETPVFCRPAGSPRDAYTQRIEF